MLKYILHQDKLVSKTIHCLGSFVVTKVHDAVDNDNDKSGMLYRQISEVVDGVR